MRSSASRDIPSSASIRPALTPTENITGPRPSESPASRAPPHLNQALTHLASLIPHLHPDLDNPVFLASPPAPSTSPASWSLADDAVCKSILALTASAMADFQPPWDVTSRTEPHHAQDISLSQVRQTAAALANMLDENKEEKVLKEACVGLCQLFGEGIQNDRIQAILDANVVPKLVALLRPSRARAVPISVQSAALQVLGNVACGDDRQTQVVIDSDALPCLRALLASADRSIRKEVCWIVSNITESSHQVQDVLDADILPPLLKLLDNQDAACREDATWVLFNLSSNREPRQIAYLAEKNGVRALCNLLTCSKDLDVLWKGCGTVAAVALKGLRNILICGQHEAASDSLGYNRMAALVAEAHGVERIEALTAQSSHTPDDVRTRARLLLERMFGAEPATVDVSRGTAGPAAPIAPALGAPPPPPMNHAGCSCSYQHHHQAHSQHYPATANFESSGGQAGSSSSTVDQNGHAHNTLGEATGSTSASSTDSDPEDEDSDSDLIPPPPAPCNCQLCAESAPLSERRPRGKPVGEEGSSDSSRKGLHSESRHICNFCSGGGRLGDGRAGLAAKLGRAVRLGHSHCIALLLSRMTWSQRGAATEAPALLHPGGGPTGGFGTSLPAIILAASLGKPECLALLLRRCKPDLNQTYGKNRYTPLAWAASKGYLRCTQLLIEHGADPSTKCAEGITALHLAAKGGGNVAICRMLIEHNAPVNALTEKKQTPLCLAARKGNVKIIELLLNHGGDPNNEDIEKYTPVHIAAMNGFVDCLDLLLRADATVDCKTLKGVTPLHFAVQKQRPACVRLLIAAGAKVNCTKKPLLLVAADEGNRDVVQILLDSLANIDCKASIKAFLDKDNEVSDYLTPLHLAASKGNQEVVELLLRRGASVDAATDNSKWTALDFAVLNGHGACAVVLLKHGATVSDNCKNIGRNNWTLVQYAANHGAKEVVRLLIQRLKEQRMKTIHGGKFSMNAPDVIPSPTKLHSTTQEHQSAVGMLPPLSPAPDLTPFSSMPPTTTSRSTGATCESVSSSHTHSHHPVLDSGLHTCSHVMNNYTPPTPEDYLTATSSLSTYDADALPLPKMRYGNDKAFANGNTSHTLPPPSDSSSTKRRAPKEDRESARRTREIRKRETEAAEARDRLDEAITQRSITKLTEAIAHVSKLVLHLTTTVGGDTTAPTGGVPEYNDVDGYGSFADSGGMAPGNPSANGRHASPAPPAPLAPVPSSTPLAVEVGLGNEVAKARKMLAELQGEERRARDERAREAADSKRENAQQTVAKAITSTLQGGDPRVLARAVNRALRTVLDRDDPVILEADRVTTTISALEKAEASLRSAKEARNLSALKKATPVVEEALKAVSDISGNGAAERIFGGPDPVAMIAEAKAVCDELEGELRTAEEEKIQAENREREAQEKLANAVKTGNMLELESALEHASDALLSKDSDLATTIDSAKRTFAKFLKSERRKLRQANATNDPDVIDAAVVATVAMGLKALDAEVDVSRQLARKLREQEAAREALESAIENSDTTVLGEIKNKLTSLGMFSEAERARSELDTLQRAARAHSLLETAIADARANIESYRKRKKSSGNGTSSDDGGSEWVWPDTQRLYELSERSRKYGSSIQKLCDSANDLLRNLAIAGREVLVASISSDDATVIAACISGYEKSFMSSPCSKLFAKDVGARTLADARRKLAQVQAIDQAKVRAESNKVKVEYVKATMRRTTVRNRSSRNNRSAGNTHGNSSSNSQPTPPKVVSPGVAANGSSKFEIQSGDSNNSSEYGGDDEASDVDTTGHPTMAEHLRNVEHARHNGLRRPRVTVLRPVDEQISAEGGDSGGGSRDCSHYYLFKGGTTISCARCGNLRNTNNPDWLARVKKREGKLPPDLSTPVSPHNGAGAGPPNMRPLASGNYAMPNMGIAYNGPARGERSSRPSRATPSMVGNMSMPMGPQGVPLSSGLPIGSISQLPFMARGQMSVSGAPPAPVSKRSAKMTPATQHRARARPQDVNVSVGLDGLGRSSTSMYGRNPIAVGPLGIQNGLNMPHQMGQTYRGEMVGGLDQHGNGKNLSPLSSGMSVHGNRHLYGVGIGGMRQRIATSPVRAGGAGNHPISIIGRPRVDGTQGSMNMNIGSSTRTGTGTSDDFGSGNADLGEEFANQNFGFDIDAIVDDVDDDNVPLPPEPKMGRGGGRSTMEPSQSSSGYF